MRPAWDYSRFTICGEPTGSDALHEALDGVFAGDDADEFSLRIDHGGQTETSSAEALDDSIGRLGIARDDDAAHVTGEGFAARFLEQNVEGIDQADGLTVR